jgi:hypothetical protein
MTSPAIRIKYYSHGKIVAISGMQRDPNTVKPIVNGAQILKQVFCIIVT